jgi:hypothetical protein
MLFSQKSQHIGEDKAEEEHEPHFVTLVVQSTNAEVNQHINAENFQTLKHEIQRLY